MIIRIHHAPMLAELRRIFAENQVDGHVRFVYETQVYYGRFDRHL
jgi:hypothetical protein